MRHNLKRVPFTDTALREMAINFPRGLFTQGSRMVPC